MPKVETHTEKTKFAAYLVSIGEGLPPTEKEIQAANREEERLRTIVPDSELLRRELATRPQVFKVVNTDPPNLGPNPPGHAPQPFGLLDFQDIALFLWPPYRQHPGYELEDQCHILKHRNPRIRNLTLEELVEVQAWMDGSDTITVEENHVNIREWRLKLSEEEQATLVKQMDRDLNQVKVMKRYVRTVNTTGNSRRVPNPEEVTAALKRKRKLAALRRIEDEDEDY